MRGLVNSSVTRVRPFFSLLLRRDPSGATWLPDLLEAADQYGRLDPALRRRPGDLLTGLVQTRRYADRILDRTIDRPNAFEHPAPPSAGFLRWLIEHPEQLRWPERSPGVRVSYGAATQRHREALVDGGVEERDAAQALALSELDGVGAAGSRRRWWAFEGFTEVDCWLETDRLLLFVEGKRTEPLSHSTDWFQARDQLVRNMEVAGDLAGSRAAAVLLVTEQPVDELPESVLSASTPHLDDEARDVVRRRYLGQTTWRALSERLDVDFAALPETRVDVDVLGGA